MLAIAAIVIHSSTLAGPARAEPPGPVSGRPLKVLANGGVGLLASPNAYKTVPLGCARIYGQGRPDLFVSATHGIERAMYLYRWVRDNEQGQPVFAPPVRVRHPFGDASPPAGTILEDAAGHVHGFWLQARRLIHCRFDREAMAFVQLAQLDLAGLPRAPDAVAILSMADDRLDVVVACSNGAKYRPPGDESSDNYVLYDGAGAFRGHWPRAGLYRIRARSDLSAIVEAPHLFSASNEEILGGVALTAASYPSKPAACVIAGASLGNLYCFDAADLQAKSKSPLVGPGLQWIRHPTIGAAPIAYPDAGGHRADLIVGGEGSLYYYPFSGKFTAEGHPIYGDAQPVWQQDAQLYAGTLAVPNAVDWDGDGATDLVVGNSEGRILFFRNHGTDREPKFGIGAPILANGEPIHIQPGYYGIQGPFETRWGYSCPTTADWNGDGLPDLLLSSATARHEVFLNIGAPGNPRLAAARPLYADGLELHGTWRVKPGVERIDGRMAYVIQDDANALHRYWRLDDQNLSDAGPLRMEDGSLITSHSAGGGPGQKGRGKIAIVDWDGDGRVDLLVGTAKRGSIPEPQAGLPWSRRRNGEEFLQVVLLRNCGSNAVPKYEQPRLFQFQGKDIYLGAHSNAPAPCRFGAASGGPNLLIGMESGRIYFFSHADLTLRNPDGPR